jgi:hypothetical protein
VQAASWWAAPSTSFDVYRSQKAVGSRFLLLASPVEVHRIHELGRADLASVVPVAFESIEVEIAGEHNVAGRSLPLPCASDRH